MLSIRVLRSGRKGERKPDLSTWFLWNNLLDLPRPVKLFLVKGRRKGIGFELSMWGLCLLASSWRPVPRKKEYKSCLLILMWIGLGFKRPGCGSECVVPNHEYLYLLLLLWSLHVQLKSKHTNISVLKSVQSLRSELSDTLFPWCDPLEFSDPKRNPESKTQIIDYNRISDNCF